MCRFLHVTDIHATAGRDRPEDSLAALDRVVAIANELRPAPDFVVLSGDLTDEGDRESYAALATRLAALEAPVIFALGNHDHRAAFREVFGGHPGAADAPLDHESLIGGVHVVVLDTSEPGRVSGTLEAGQLEYLAAALDRHPGMPKVIVMHHPPFLEPGTGRRWSQLGAEDTDRLARTLAGREVALILSGHVHLDRLRLWQGVPVVSTAGLFASADPTAPATAEDAMRFVAGASYALCDLREGGVDVTFLPVSERETLRVVPGSVMRALS
jgi:3',5'-cyclic-AMP phosphodiesterase